MALAISSKSQPLTLISCGQLRTSPAKSARRDFLGCCGHNLLRPPGSRRILYRKRTGRKLKVHGNRGRSVLISASLDLNSAMVAVTVTALSALSIAYFYHHYFNKKRRQNKVLDLPNFSLSQVAKDISDRIIGSWFWDVEEKSQDMEMETPRDNDKEIEGEEVHVQFQMHDNDPSVEKAESSRANFVASGACSSVISEEYEAAGLSPLPALLADSGSPLPVISVTESELTPENSGKETHSDSVLSDLVVEVNSNTASVAVSDESGDKGNDKLSTCDAVIDEAVREDIHTFYAATQSVVETPPKLNGLKAINSHENSCSSLKLESPLRTAELSPKQSPQISGGSGLKDGTNGRMKEHSIIENNVKLPLAPSPNGIRSDGKAHYIERMRTYKRLLSNWRLAECVALLEDMKRNGLLDMNKVHHAKFFKVCKSKKAVTEAFSFCKLVPNPTLSTFNMVMSVCAASQDTEGALQVLRLAQEAGFKPDCKLYTTLVSTCAKSGKVDAMFEVFHAMVNAGVEPNVNTYGALIDGCAREGQVAKAFGAYGIMRSKNVKPDRVVFNALITACGKSGAVHRAFDVLAEMKSETHPIDPDHVTVGALMKACANAGQVERAQEVYNLMYEYNIRGTPEVYTIAVNCCSQTGDFEFACKVYDDMRSKGVAPDEIFLSALIDVAGHAGNLDAAFDILNEARNEGTQLGNISYSSLMGACRNAKNWQKALELYDEIKSIKLKPRISTMNALITALCDGDQLPKAMQVLFEMKNFGLHPNMVTYSVLIVASERNDDIDTGLTLLSQAQDAGVSPNLIMYKCIVGMCLRRYKRACDLGEPVVSIDSERPHLENKWTSVALMAYRETISSGEIPTIDLVSQVLGCLQLPCDASLKSRLVEDLAYNTYSSRHYNPCSLVDGFGEYDPRAFSLLEEAASLGIVPCVSFKESAIFVDAKMLQIHVAEVYFLTILKGLKHRLAAGAKLPSIIILLPIEKAQIMTPEGEKSINLTGRIGQEVASLLRRLGLPYQGNESYGKIRINGISLKRWLQPRIEESPFSERPGEWSSSQSRIGQGIMHQQRNIRTGNWSFE